MVYCGNLTLFLYTGLDNGAGEKSYYITAIAGLTNAFFVQELRVF